MVLYSVTEPRSQPDLGLVRNKAILDGSFTRLLAVALSTMHFNTQKTFLSLFAVSSYHGEKLKLRRVQRHQMGAYLCIASNSVPPSVSKRIRLNVNCKYLTNQQNFWDTKMTKNLPK